MTRSTAFSTVSNGLALPLKPGQTATYSATVASTKTFTGLLVLQRSRNGGQSWETVTSFDGRTVTITAGSSTGTVENTTGGRELYRFICTNAGDADPITGALTDVADAERTITDATGRVVMTFNRDGSVTIASGTLTAATLTALSNTDTLLQAWAAGLPTSDPAVAGAFWKSSGAIKVSAG
jgi:hypothetical protein